MKRLWSAPLLALVIIILAGAAAQSAYAVGPLWIWLGRYFECVRKADGSYSTLSECVNGAQPVLEEDWEREWHRALIPGHLNENQGVDPLGKRKSGSGSFKLKSSTITIECSQDKDLMKLIGGRPATDTDEIKLTECTVVGKTEAQCHVSSSGEPTGSIAVNAKTEVIYLGSKGEAEKEEGLLGDLFTPATGETFTVLDVAGTSCPIFTKGEDEVKGSVIAEITPVETVQRTLYWKFPTSPIGKGFRWESKATVKEVKSDLTAFGAVEVAEVGEAEVAAESGEEWGVART